MLAQLFRTHDFMEWKDYEKRVSFINEFGYLQNLFLK
jgi:hypothetical protein